MVNPVTLKEWIKEWGGDTEQHSQSILFHFDNKESTTIRVKETWASDIEQVLLSLGYEAKWDNDEVCQVKGWERDER
jgi:hypothetical protein